MCANMVRLYLQFRTGSCSARLSAGSGANCCSGRRAASGLWQFHWLQSGSHHTFEIRKSICCSRQVCLKFWPLFSVPHWLVRATGEWVEWKYVLTSSRSNAVCRQRTWSSCCSRRPREWRRADCAHHKACEGLFRFRTKNYQTMKEMNAWTIGPEISDQATYTERVRSNSLECIGPSRDAVLPDASDDRRTKDECGNVDAFAFDELLKITIC